MKRLQEQWLENEPPMLELLDWRVPNDPQLFEGYARALSKSIYRDLVRCGSFRGAQGAAEAARPTQGENRHVCRPQCAPRSTHLFLWPCSRDKKRA